MNGKLSLLLTKKNKIRYTQIKQTASITGHQKNIKNVNKISHSDVFLSLSNPFVLTVGEDK